MKGHMFSFRFSVLHLAGINGESMLWVFFRRIWFNSICIGFSQPPILASRQSVVDRSCYHLALGIQPFQHTWQRILLFHCTWQLPKSQHWTFVLHINWTHSSHLSWTLPGVPQIASFWSMCNILLHFSHYSFALNHIFTAYTLSPPFPNYLSSLQQMEPMPSQVKNHYSQTNQEAHHERTLALKQAAKLQCPSNVSLWCIFLHVLYCPGPLSPISFYKQDNHPNQEIRDNNIKILQSLPYGPTL